MKATDTEVSGEDRVGTWVRGKYLLEAVIGAGGMATVYAARHRNQKRFAIKMLHLELSHRADIRARFVREGYVANAVGHPGAVSVLDEDVAEDGSAFLVMELLDGASLETIAEGLGGKLPLEAVMAAGYQVADVLAAAHAHNVVHRDIKPANLFVTREGQVKVLDYGIARLREEGVTKTQTGAALGTPAFMSPEQASGKTSRVDERSDVWSLGATMCWLLTGQFVHEGETPQHMMVLAATEPPASVTVTSPELPGLAATIIDRALAFDKAARWPSAAAMRDALAAAYVVLFGGPLTEAPLVDLAKHAGSDISSLPTAPDANEATRWAPFARPPAARQPRASRVDATTHSVAGPAEPAAHAADPAAPLGRVGLLAVAAVVVLSLASVALVVRQPASSPAATPITPAERSHEARPAGSDVATGPQLPAEAPTAAMPPPSALPLASPPPSVSVAPPAPAPPAPAPRTVARKAPPAAPSAPKPSPSSDFDRQ